MDNRARVPNVPCAASAELAARPEAASAARRLLEPFGGRVHEGVVERAKLLVSELVANSVVHGSVSAPIRLRVESRSESLRVQVTDAGPSFEPVVRHPSSESQSGWGLFLVDTLSDRWGVDPSGTDVTVWFELDAR